MSVSAAVSPQKVGTEHPLQSLRRAWLECKKKERKSFDYEPYRDDIRAYLSLLQNRGPCEDIHNVGRSINCTCLHDLDLTGEEEDSVIDYLIDYAKLSFDEQRARLLEWKKYARLFKYPVKATGNNHQHYLLPGSRSYTVCKNGLSRVIGKSRHAWDSVDDQGKKLHGLAEMPSNNSMEDAVMESLHEYFQRLRLLGAPRATLLIRSIVGNKTTTDLKSSEEVIELPACTSKRSLYRSYLRDHGWEVQLDNIGREVSRKRTGDAIEGSLEEYEPPSWTTFIRFWQNNYKEIVIQPASEDLCDECFVFANRHKYGANRKKQFKNELEGFEEDETGLADETTTDYSALMEINLENEELILAAAKHVAMAKAQRDLFIKLKEDAASMATLPAEERHYTFVCDFAQNMYLPNFSSEQPGATYYYSPLNVYPFGIVDCSQNPTELTAHMFVEGQQKKGGNTVVSCIWKELERKGLRSGKTAKELNLVFDNCAGQNKNRMVYRFLFYLVKMKITRVARAIFLVKGHTKNDCDRMFNLMKREFRKSNVYTPNELFLLCNNAEHVKALQLFTREFLDWDSLQDTMVSKADGILKNHIFCVTEDDSNRIAIQEYDGAPTMYQELVKNEYQAADSSVWVEAVANRLKILPTPGLPDIKWKELYYKWGRFVPETNKRGLIYYNKKPPKDVEDKIAANIKQSRLARSSRTRDAVSRKKKKNEPKRQKSDAQTGVI